MRAAARRPEAWLVVLAATSAAAWAAVALGGSDMAVPIVCSASLGGVPPGSLDLAFGPSLGLALNPPLRLAGDWALMLVAMMAPAIILPLRHVHDRSFARRRVRAMLLFCAGYAAVWFGAGVVLQAMALAAWWIAPAASIAVAAAVALVWQISPAKQWCLNRCHRRPELAAFGAAADGDAAAFGIAHGAACVGACWSLMLLPLLAGAAHGPAMVAAALFIWAERLEAPAPLGWRWRGAGKALRMAAAQVRLRLAPRQSVGEAAR